jgi:hypothetical protein
MNKKEEILKSEAVKLLRDAISYIESGSPEKAVWRAVDGIGMLACMIDGWQKGGHVGLAIPTGRGFQLIKDTPSEYR